MLYNCPSLELFVPVLNLVMQQQQNKNNPVVKNKQKPTPNELNNINQSR